MSIWKNETPILTVLIITTYCFFHDFTDLYYNKSKGLKDLIKNGKYSFLNHNESWIALIDPDFLFLRPLIAKEINFKESKDSINRNTILWPLPPLDHGMGQLYEIGSPWTDESFGFHRREVCGNYSKCVTIDEEEVEKYYTVGSPYILRVGDWKRLVKTWAEFATRYSHYSNYAKFSNV